MKRTILLVVAMTLLGGCLVRPMRPYDVRRTRACPPSTHWDDGRCRPNGHGDDHRRRGGDDDDDHDRRRHD